MIGVQVRKFCSCVVFIVFVLINEIPHSKEDYVVNETFHESNLQNRNVASKILEFHDNHAKNVQFSKRKELILLFGDSDHEKTMLALLLVEAEMKAVQISSNKFIFTDRNGLMDKYSSIITPKLIADTNSGSEYFIFPGWNRTMSGEQGIDITTAYFNHRMLNFASAIKIVFVVSYERFKDCDIKNKDQYGAKHAKREAYGNRQYLRDLTANAINWMKNIDKFSESISLVVTNVDDADTDDEHVINFIARVMNLVKADFAYEPKYNHNITHQQKEANDRKIEFIESMIQMSGLRYEKIGILRITNQTGSVTELPWLQNEKKSISFNIHNNMKYAENGITDFQFPFSTEARKIIPELFEEVKKRLISDVSNIGADIRTFFLQQEKLYPDLRNVYDQMYLGYEYI